MRKIPFVIEHDIMMGVNQMDTMGDTLKFYLLQYVCTGSMSHLQTPHKILMQLTNGVQNLLT